MGEIAIEPDCLIEISNGAVLIALVPIWEAPFVVDGRSCSMNNFTEGVRVRCFRVTATTGSGELTTEITMSKDSAPRKQNYKVKKVEAIAVGTDVQARMFTLAPADVIPWHRHSECMDHYFVLRGALTIETRNPDDRRMLKVGDRHQIKPGTAHLLSNGGAEDCEFLLIQGVGKYDWIKAEADR